MTTREGVYFHDPYHGCETRCHHDLAKGVLTDELRSGDGPYPATPPKMGMGPLAGMLIEMRNREESDDGDT